MASTLGGLGPYSLGTRARIRRNRVYVATALAAVTVSRATMFSRRDSVYVASALTAVTVSRSSMFSVFALIALSTLPIKPVFGLQNGEFARITNSMPFGK